MNKFEMKLLYNKEEYFCTQTELLIFKLTLPLAKLALVIARLVSNGFGFLVSSYPVSNVF